MVLRLKLPSEELELGVGPAPAVAVEAGCREGLAYAAKVRYSVPSRRDHIRDPT